MRTSYSAPEQYVNAIMEIEASTSAVGKQRPKHFIRVMRENRGNVNFLSPFGPGKDGMERKNPLVAALGDSVTAGHFEFNGQPEELFKKADAGLLGPEDAIEITDARECYLEKFRSHLIDHFEQTSVSVVNSGIAGDNVYGMQKRLYRDVIRYQPDLVIINASLNWSAECGDTKTYQRVLSEIVETIRQETKADIVLMTPNMEIPGPFTNPASSLDERVSVIRNMAEEKQVCLADTYKVWELYQSAGYPVKALLANGMNHPSKECHELFARVLMQLIL